MEKKILTGHSSAKMEDTELQLTGMVINNIRMNLRYSRNLRWKSFYKRCLNDLL